MSGADGSPGVDLPGRDSAATYPGHECNPQHEPNQSHPREPHEGNQFLACHANVLLNSLQRWTGRSLFPDEQTDEARARRLFYTTFAVVSHNTDIDPIFNYANLMAMSLFEIHWDEFTKMPSRLSAEPMHRDERARLMEEVRRNGYISNYGGIRISKGGKRFRIEDALVWNLVSDSGDVCGQAAMFAQWHFLP